MVMIGDDTGDGDVTMGSAVVSNLKAFPNQHFISILPVKRSKSDDRPRIYVCLLAQPCNGAYAGFQSSGARF